MSYLFYICVVQKSVSGALICVINKTIKQNKGKQEQNAGQRKTRKN